MSIQEPIPDLFRVNAPPAPTVADALFDAGNPGVFDLFLELAKKVRERGFTRYSADAILHQMRWHHHMEKGNRAFVVNDHWSSLLSRRLARECPEFETFFEFRKSRHDAQSA